MLIDILGTGVTAGVVIFLLNVLRDWFLASRRKQVNAKRQAFDLSNKLKILNIRFSEIISDHEVAEPPPGEQRPEVPELPEFDFVKLAEGLPDLDMKDLSRIADLQIQKEVEDSYIRFGWQVWMDEGDIEKLQLRRLKHLASESDELANLVREKHKLPDFGDHKKLIREK